MWFGKNTSPLLTPDLIMFLNENKSYKMATRVASNKFWGFHTSDPRFLNSPSAYRAVGHLLPSMPSTRGLVGRGGS